MHVKVWLDYSLIFTALYFFRDVFGVLQCHLKLISGKIQIFFPLYYLKNQCKCEQIKNLILTLWMMKSDWAAFVDLFSEILGLSRHLSPLVTYTVWNNSNCVRHRTIHGRYKIPRRDGSWKCTIKSSNCRYLSCGQNVF